MRIGTTRLRGGRGKSSVLDALLTGELGRALLRESGEAFFRVRAAEQLAELDRLLVERTGRGVEQSLRCGERERSLRRELLRDAERVVEHRIGDRVHEAHPQRLLRVDHPAREDQLLRNPEAADPREALRSAPAGDDPEVDLGLAEARLARRVADVAAERELAAAAERETVDRGDRRLRHLLEEVRGFVAEP